MIGWQFSMWAMGGMTVVGSTGWAWDRWKRYCVRRNRFVADKHHAQPGCFQAKKFIADR
jgi:hypothetical protein